ncbi:hypothetical protein [Thalassospira alkalitolerans]|uniref:hypothetical protein n=1 Tax=Thalassospira alkalitolerans TaxID=1293890 RepID=UPI003AA99383
MVGERQFLNKVTEYLSRTLHAQVSGVFEEISGIPLGISHGYTTARCRVLGNDCVFLIEKSSSSKTPSAIAADAAKVEVITGHLAIFVTEKMSAYWREQFISKGTAFIQPSQQCYIPQLAIDLREHFRKRLNRSLEDKFSPITQLVLFYLLLRGEGVVSPTASHLAELLDYSPMSIGRAYQELSARSIYDIRKEGREKRLSLASSKSEIIERSKQFMISPVRKALYLEKYREVIPALHIAGESALAEYTMLSAPSIPVRAIAPDRWKRGRVREYWIEAAAPEGAVIIVEIWHYDPALLSTESVADPLSLYAQFNRANDPRLEGATEELLEKMSW